MNTTCVRSRFGGNSRRLAAVAGWLLVSAGAAWGQAPTFAAAVTYSSGGDNPYDVVVADVNGDGKPDLLTANPGSNTFGVLLGNGNGTFQAAATYPGGSSLSNPVALAVADVNGDGKLDLLAGNVGQDQASVLLGNGNGTFQAAVNYATGSRPQGIAVADVNGDGLPDLLTANTSPLQAASSSAGVLLGNGNGTFQPVVSYPTGSGSTPQGIAVADVNGDGKPDLLTANSGTASVGVLLGNGNGTFQAITSLYLGNSSSNPRNLAVADVNADGQPDLLTANFGTNSAGVLVGNGNGTFQPAVSYPGTSGGNVYDVAVADVNGDGKPDLLTANYKSSGQAGVLLGNGNGTFQAVTDFALGNNTYPQGIAAADLNGDGKPDLVTANSGYSYNTPGSVGVLLNTTTFPAPIITDFTPKNGAVGTTATLTGTNLSNLRSVRFGELSASIFSVNAAGTTLTVTVPRLASTQKISVTTPGGVAFTASAFAVTRASTAGTFTSAGNLQSKYGSAPAADINAGVNGSAKPVLTDLDGNGRLDLLLGTYDGYLHRYEQPSAAATTLTDLGNLTDGSGTVIQVPASSGVALAAPAVTDLDGNGRLDLLVGTTNGNVRRYEQTNPGTVTFADLGLLSGVSVAGGAATPAATDLDSNGRLDLLVGDHNGHLTRFEQTAPNAVSFGAGVVLSGINVLANAAPTVTDLEGNGRLDLLVGNVAAAGSTVARYEQDAAGSGTFTSRGNLGLSGVNNYNSLAPVVTDLDGDGRLDLLVGNVFGTVQRYVQAQSLNVTSLSPAANAGGVAVGSSVVATFNMPLASSPAPVLRVFGNQRGGRTGAAVVSGSTLTYTPPAGAGFAPGEVVASTITTAATSTNGATLGRPLVAQFTAAVGGTGKGRFRPGSAVPAGTKAHSVVVGDVNGDNLPDLLTANNASPGTVSVRLGTGGGAFAATGQSLTVGDYPQGLVLGDVDGDGDLDVAVANTGDMNGGTPGTTVSVFLNGGDATGSNTGSFSNGRSVTVADNPQDVTTGDVDGDGDLDLLTANYGYFTVSVSLNNGSGTFSSGQNVPASPPGNGAYLYSVAVGDVNGDGALDLLATNHDGSTVGVRLGNSDGTFATTGPNVALSGTPQTIVVGDVNGDHLLDFVTANTGNNTVGIYLGDGTGAFAAAGNPAVGNTPSSVTLGDVDADGDLDLATTNYAAGTVSLLLNNGSGIFAAPATGGTLPVGTHPQTLTLADVDNDGDLDLLAANEDSNTVSVLLNEPDVLPTISDFTPKTGPASTVVTVTGTNLAGVTGVRLGGQPVAFTVVSATSLTFTVPAAAVRQRFTLSTLTASATSAAPFAVTQPSAALLLPAAPLNGTASGLSTGQTYITPTVTDLDGNGRLDMLLGSNGGQLLRYEQTAVGATSFGSATNLTFPSGVNLGVASGAPTVTDLDGDGLLDLLVGAGGNVRRFAQSGAGLASFTDQGRLRAADGTTALDVAGSGAAAPVVADLDGNGLLDLLVGNFSGYVERFEQTGPRALTFTDLGALTTTGGAALNTGSYAHPVLTDLDGNGLLDLLVGTDTQNVHHYEQASAGSAVFGGGSLLTTNGTAPVGAYYGAPAITDLDGNGRYDLLVGDAAGNLTRYEQATGAAPLPVTLTAFTAQAQGSAAVQLAWTTASETNSARFEVERSADGVSFGNIGQVAAAGTSLTARTYGLLDASLSAGATTLYYRLRQVDQDGTAAYSPVRSVALSGAAAGLSLYPNPARTGATLTGAAPGTLVRVLDALGRVVATAAADAAGTAQLRLPAGLAPGVYAVQAGAHTAQLVVE
ncbi:MAG: FG-GAP-like repeat-containing protein [Janthinobacterium lividum]